MNFEEKLIAAIQKHTCLYNKHLVSYRKKNIKRNAWYKVAEEVRSDEKERLLTVSECQHRWRSLRDRYVREMKANSNCKWKYMSHLSFLSPYLNSRKSSYVNSNLTTTDEDSEINNTTIDHEEIKKNAEEELNEVSISKFDGKKEVDVDDRRELEMEDTDVEIDEIEGSNPMDFVAFINDEKRSRTNSVDFNERFEVNHPENKNAIKSRNEDYYKTLDSYMLQLPLNVQDDLKIEILNRIYCEVKSLRYK